MFATIGLLAAEAAGEAAPHNPILPATNEIVWGSIAFFVLLVAMWKVGLPPVRKAMEARTQRIRDDLDSAERAKAGAESILGDYQRQLADAKNEANRIIEEARQTADQLKRDLMRQAETEVAEIRQRTTDDLAAAQDRALADLQARVGVIAVGLAGKIIEKELDPATQSQLVDSYIRQVGAGSN